MKKYIIFYLILMLLATKGASADTARDELIDLAQFAKEEIAPIDEWQVTLKESMATGESTKLLNELRDDKRDISVNETSKATHYQWTTRNKSSEISTDFKLIVPTKNGYKPELVAVISGNYWKPNVRTMYQRRKSQIIEQYFSKNLTMFACLTTVERDIIPFVYVKRSVKDKMDMTYIKKQEDLTNKMHKTIIYGYTPLWTNEIRKMDDPVNFQAVIQQGPRDGFRLTLGTPILIHEY